MATKKSVPLKSENKAAQGMAGTPMKSLSDVPAGFSLFLKRVFALMFGAVALSAVAVWVTLYAGGIHLFVDFAAGKTTILYPIVTFGALLFAIWAQVRIFSMRPQVAAVLLAIYAALLGFAMTPLIWLSLAVNPVAILQAFIIAALMFGCMAMFGYKTSKDLSFLRIFLMMGMIGLILVAAFSFIWPLGSTFATIVCLIGVLVFALFTAYDMQTLKKVYTVMGDDMQKNQLAVLGAFHLYIAFIAMFQYILSLLSMRR